LKEEEGLGEGSPLPPDEDNEDTRYVSDIGLTISKLRRRPLSVSLMKKIEDMPLISASLSRMLEGLRGLM